MLYKAAMWVQRGALKIWRREPWFAELWSALASLLWVTLSVMTGTQLDAWPSMFFLSQLGDDAFWHRVAAILGGAQLACVIADERWARWAAAIFMCCFYGVVTVGWWSAAVGSPSVSFVACFFGINLYSIVRLLRDVR